MPYFPPDSGSGGSVTPPPAQINSTGAEIGVVPTSLGDPFNVGSTLSEPTSKLIERALRDSSDQNLMYPYNHRYRGDRESFKFNLHMQQLMAISAYLLPTMRTNDTTLKADEFLCYPTDVDSAIFYHCREQIRFKEWLLLKDTNISWYL